jgi:integrase/recombinase XerD
MLRSRHCDLTRGMLRVLDGKGGKDRDVPLDSPLMVTLAGMFTLEGIDRDDFLWYTRPGGKSVISRAKPIGEGSFHRWWATSLDRAGVRYMKPHTTRHTYATAWRREGLDVDEIQLLLGHESIRTTSDLYVHTDIRDVAARMAELRGEE